MNNYSCRHLWSYLEQGGRIFNARDGVDRSEMHRKNILPAITENNLMKDINDTKKEDEVRRVSTRTKKVVNEVLPVVIPEIPAKTKNPRKQPAKAPAKKTNPKTPPPKKSTAALPSSQQQQVIKHIKISFALEYKLDVVGHYSFTNKATKSSCQLQDCSAIRPRPGPKTIASTSASKINEEKTPGGIGFRERSRCPSCGKSSETRKKENYEERKLK